jgi:hypothetical protein
VVLTCVCDLVLPYPLAVSRMRASIRAASLVERQSDCDLAVTRAALLSSLLNKKCSWLDRTEVARARLGDGTTHPPPPPTHPTSLCMERNGRQSALMCVSPKSYDRSTKHEHAHMHACIIAHVTSCMAVLSITVVTSPKALTVTSQRVRW